MVQLARCYQALFSFQLWIDIVLVLLFSFFIYLEVKSAFLSFKKKNVFLVVNNCNLLIDLGYFTKITSTTQQVLAWLQ